VSAPIKKVSKKVASFNQKPADLVVDIVGLQQIGLLIARENALKAGDYDLVVEYKMGQTALKESSGTTYPSIAVAVAGIGLKPSEKPGPVTITVSEPPKRVAKSPAPKRAKT